MIDDCLHGKFRTFRILFSTVVIIPLSVISADVRPPALSDSEKAEYLELLAGIDSCNRVLAKRIPEERKIANEQALILPSDKTPADIVIRRTAALLGSIARKHPRYNIDAFRNRLELLESRSAGLSLAKSLAGGTSESQRFNDAIALRREIALANPAVDFDTLLFTGIVKPGGSFHMCDQYLGWNVKNGGGLYLLTGIKSGKPVAKNLLANVKVAAGALAGKTLSPGAVLSPDLSFDGKKIAFAWTSQDDKCYHIFTINTDGTNLVQLTSGKAPNNGKAEESHNDFDPCFLPNGRIAFISERRGGYGRCHPRNVPTYTLYSMKDDGSDITCLSYHETNEWQPSVNNQGQIVYTRWDYLDRDDCIAHHLWLCDPDGCNPRAPHGNYPLPLSTLSGSSWADGRAARPNGEWNIRAIPGSSKYVATASGHHTHSFGQLVLIDITKKDDGKMSQVTGITTSQTKWSDTDGPYGTAWPLSEELYLCNYNSQIVLLDDAGNREVLYTAETGVRPIDPIPVKPRQTPPALSVKTWQGERTGKPEHTRATISIMNVYNSDLPLGMTSGIVAMRIVQVFPQFTPLINEPRVGYASESLARMVLGTVPVEKDGSVYCEAPVGKEIYFQLLDDKGRAVHSMRAGAYVHPGEQLTCLGCHEDKWSAPPDMKIPLALNRAPSPLTPDAGGVEPVNFYRLVKPIFDKKCAPCHKEKGKGPDMSYKSLEAYTFWWPGPGNPYVNGDIVTAKHGGSRTMPGKFGANASPLAKNLTSAHNNVELTNEELRRITLWLDCNSNELGAYTKVADQKSGKLVWAELDCDIANPTGIEKDRPVASPTSVQKRLASLLHFTRSPVVRYNAAQRTLSVSNMLAEEKCVVTLFDAAGRQIWKSAPLFSHKSGLLFTDAPRLGNGLVIAQIYSGTTVERVRMVYGR